jgi:hypothetical protein
VSWIAFRVCCVSYVACRIGLRRVRVRVKVRVRARARARVSARVQGRVKVMVFFDCFQFVRVPIFSLEMIC